jgi:hypothetical protein
MQRKHLLVAASAAAMALGLATQAAALTTSTLTYSPTTTGNEIGAIAPSDLQGIPGSYLVGTESNFGAGPIVDQGTLAMDFTIPGGIPSDTTTLTVKLTNATFGTTFAHGAVTFTPVASCGTSTVVGPITGGGAGDSQATFFVSAGTLACMGPIHLEIPVNIDGGTLGNVSVETQLTLNTNNTLYADATYANAIVFQQALVLSSITELNENHENTYASLMDYRTLGPDDSLGDAIVTLNTHEHYDLINDEWVNTDVTSSQLVVTGGWATIGPHLVKDTTAPPVPGTLGPCVVDSSLSFCTAVSGAAGPWTYDVNLRLLGGQPVIQPSPYSAAISETLAHSIYASSAYTVSGLALNPLGRQGSFAIVPWTASTAQAALTGSSNIIRVSNIGASPTGPVLVEVLASTCHPATGPAPCTSTDPVGAAPFALTASIAPGTDFMVDPAAVAAGLGEFGRGDLKITVVADPRTVTLKKEIMRNGNISDQSLGSFADGQAASLTVGEQNIAPASLQFNEPPGVNTTCIGGSTPGSCFGAGNNPLNNQNLSGTFIPLSVPNQGVTTPPASNPDNPPPFAPPF